MPQEVPARGWMQWFLGAEEPEVIARKEQFIDENGCFRGRAGQVWPAGVFECPRVADLREQVAQLPARRAPEEPACPLNVVDGVDIGQYQARWATEQGAMVQIASNFHCLENGNPSVPADCGRLVSGYAVDCTQGPAAAFGVPAASLLRAHYAFKAAGRPPSEWGQTSARQVNLIDELCQEGYCGDCQNGKARLLGELKPVTEKLIDEVAGKVKVGLHKDAQVVFSRGSKSGQLAVMDDPQCVDQVCSATLCYGFANRTYNPPKEQLENLTRALLRAAYEGAYLSAILRQRKVLLLTLIGGACFRNPHELILAELRRAHDMFASHPASQLQEVQLVLYERGAAREYQLKLDQLN